MKTQPTDQLLRDAIADAKQIREAAIANARIVIEEAFTPHISSMLSKKLRNELEEPTAADGHGKAEGGETDEKAITEEENPDDSNIGKGENSKPSTGASDSSNVGKSGAAVKTVDMSEALEEPTAADGHGSAEGGETDKAAITESDDEDIDDEYVDDESALDIDEVIAELESDIDDEESDDVFGGEEDSFGGEEGGDASLDLGSEEGGDDLNLDAPATDDIEGGDALDLGDESEEGSMDLDMSAPEGDVPSEDEEEVDLEELVREMEAENSAAPHAQLSAMTSENAQLKRNLREHRQVVHYLREKLQEVNMLNAKLLYTNKLFKANTLTLAQKQRVVETFDRAKTIRETKLVYTTLAESLNSSPAAKGRTSSITEGFASKRTGSNTLPKNPKVLSEVASVEAAADAEFISRMKKLAGIR